MFSLGQIDNGQLAAAGSLITGLVSGKVIAPEEPWIRGYLGLPAPLAPNNGGTGRVPTVERFTFGAESKTKLIDRLTLGLSGRAVQYPAHRVLLSELRAFEYGAVGGAGRAKMGGAVGSA